MLSHPGASAPSRFCIIPEKRSHEFRTSSLIHPFITDDLDQPYRLLMALRSQQVRPSDHRVSGNASGDQEGNDARRGEHPIHRHGQDGRAGERKEKYREKAGENERHRIGNRDGTHDFPEV
jgi:hypothetical protein